jgi:hypothetical protein
MGRLTVKESSSPIKTHEANRAHPGYKSRLEDLLERTPLTEAFPEEMFTEEWFVTRELDLSDDEEIIHVMDDDGYVEDDEDDIDDDSDEEEYGVNT